MEYYSPRSNESTSSADEESQSIATSITLTNSESSIQSDMIDDEYSDSPSLLANTNKLLEWVNIMNKPILSLDELFRVSSSLFVAVFESLFRMQIPGVNRQPKLRNDYIHNAQLVVDHLSEQIQMDLKHITGNAIVDGDKRVLSNLVHILVRIVSITSQESLSSIETSESMMKEGVRGGGRDPRHKIDIRDIPYLKKKIQATQRSGEALPVRVPKAKGNGILGSSYKGYKSYKHSKLAASQDRLHRLHTTAIQKAQKVFHLEDKMESARQRRERLRYMREAHYRKNNMIRAEKSMRAMNNRWMEDKKRESKAFVMRKNSMDDVMAQQVYRGLLRQLRSWRLEEQSELLEKMSKDEKEASLHLDSLKNFFDERIDMLREQQSTIQHFEDTRGRDIAETRDELLRTVNSKSQQWEAKSSAALAHSREKELFRRQEGYSKIFRDFLNAAHTQPTSSNLPTNRPRERERKRSTSIPRRMSMSRSFRPAYDGEDEGADAVSANELFLLGNMKTGESKVKVPDLKMHDLVMKMGGAKKDRQTRRSHSVPTKFRMQ